MTLRSSIACALALASILVIPVQAQARHRHHGRHLQHQRLAPSAQPADHVHCDDRFLWTCDVRGPSRSVHSPQASHTIAVTRDRPRDCYGIAWCGCWLRHYFGLADRALNLAINWARMGVAATADSANVVVWRHHVGRLLAHRAGMILVQSGNDGHAVRTRWRTLRGVVALRRV
jgi:hypothetical protein